MRKWPLLFVCVAVGLIGCGGSGSGGGTTPIGTTGSTAGTTGRSTQGITIPSNGNDAVLDIYFLPGQARQITGYTANLFNILFYDVNGISTNNENNEPPNLSIGLGTFDPVNELLSAHVPYPGSGGSVNSRYFTRMDLDFTSLQINGTGGETFTGTNGNGFPYSFPNLISMTAFPGRFTAMQLYVNSGTWDFSQAPPVFQTATFEAANVNPQDGRIDGFLSDYLSFDISHVASRPTFTNFPGTAGRIFISGDFFAEGQNTPASSATSTGFEVLTPYGTLPGTYKGIDPVVGIASYQVTQPNPNTLSVNPGSITSLEGTWFDQSARVTATDSTVMVTFPGNRDLSTQQLAIITRSGGVITNMYFGTLNFTGTGGAATFNAYPISDLEPGSVAGKVSGTLSGFLGSSSASVSTSAAGFWRNVRSGSYTISTGTASGIASSSKFYVYRV